MWYRALTALSIGVKQFGIFPESRLKPEAATILEAKGFITPVVGPPISALPSWARRLDTLNAAGVETLTDLLDVRSVPGIDPATLKTWITEARALLSVKQCRRCRR